MRRIAITVASNSDVHLSLVKLLNSSNSLIQPHYFLFKKEAEDYLENGHVSDAYNPDTINYTLNNNGQNHEIALHVSYNDLPQTINALELLKSNKLFAKKHKDKFKLLTVKELEIFKLVVLGNSNKDIGAILFIQASTVATHRKHIIKKLETRSYVDL